MRELLWAAILSPMAIGLVLLVFRRLGRLVRGISAVLGTVVSLGALVALWSLVGGLGRMFNVGRMLMLDNVGLILGTAFGLIWLLVTLYSVSYLGKHEHQDDYYGFLLVMLGAVVGICFARNLIALYVFWELAGLATWRLVAFFRRSQEIAIAGRTLLITFTGSVLMLVGLAWIYLDTGSLDFAGLSCMQLDVYPALLLLAGIATKSASLPLYVWLPDAHTAAPSPVSALLSGVVAKVGLIAYVRLFVQSGVSLPVWWGGLVAVLGVIGALVAGACALRECDIKRVLAFSTVSQLGYIFIAFAFVSGAGLAAGILYLLAHALAKAGLFLALGQVEHSTHRRDIHELGGLARTMPVTAVAVALLMLSIIGVPPLLGFFGKFLVLMAVVPWNLWVAVGAVLATVLTLLYMLRLYRVFVGPSRDGVVGREDKVMTSCIAVLALLSVGLGVAFPFLQRLVERSLRL